MTERDAEYAASTPAQKLRAQMEGRRPSTHAVVRVEGLAQRRERMEKQIERRPAAEKTRGSEDAETGIRRLFAERIHGTRIEATEEGVNR